MKKKTIIKKGDWLKKKFRVKSKDQAAAKIVQSGKTIGIEICWRSKKYNKKINKKIEKQ